MERMSEPTGLISSLSLMLVQTQAARWKAATAEQLTGAHLYLDIAKSGYLFHAIRNVIGPVRNNNNKWTLYLVTITVKS